MNSKNRFRRSPPVCLLVAAVLALFGRLRLRHQFVGGVIPQTQLAKYLERRVV